jgi:hypothetical protein
MKAPHPSPTEPSALEDEIRRSIRSRTGAQIQLLQVEVRPDKIVLSGITSRYYHKQLAIQSVFDAIGSRRDTSIEINIQVDCYE